MGREEKQIELKFNRGTKAAIDANIDQIGEDEFVLLTDKAVPIPTDSDSGKILKVDATGNYILGTGGGGGEPDEFLKIIEKNETDKTITVKDQDDNETNFHYIDQEVEDEITNDNTKVPSSKAIYEYMASGNFGNPRYLDGSTNLNYIQDTGFYYVDKEASSRPVEAIDLDVGGYFVVIRKYNENRQSTSKDYMQLFMVETTQHLYLRSLVNNAWKNWKLICDEDTVDDKIAQTIDNKVDKTTTVNGHALSSDVTVSKSDVGLGSVPNVATNDQTPTFSQASSLTNIASGEKLSVIFGKVMKAIADLISHIANKSNPHAVTKSQVGLGSVSNTGDSATPTSGGTTKFTTGGAYTELAKKVNTTTTVNGHALSSNVTVSKSDVGLGSVVNTGDSATPVSGGTTKFTTGGAYTQLAKKANAVNSSVDNTYANRTALITKLNSDGILSTVFYGSFTTANENPSKSTDTASRYVHTINIVNGFNYATFISIHRETGKVFACAGAKDNSGNWSWSTWAAL